MLASSSAQEKKQEQRIRVALVEDDCAVAWNGWMKAGLRFLKLRPLRAAQHLLPVGT